MTHAEKIAIIIEALESKKEEIEEFGVKLADDDKEAIDNADAIKQIDEIIEELKYSQLTIN